MKVVVTTGATVSVPFGCSDCGGTPLPVITTDVAFCVCHDSVIGWPEMENDGLEVNEMICTDPTFNVTLA